MAGPYRSEASRSLLGGHHLLMYDSFEAPGGEVAIMICQWIGAAFMAMVVLGLLAKLSATEPLGTLEAGPAVAPAHASPSPGAGTAAASLCCS